MEVGVDGSGCCMQAALTIYPQRTPMGAAVQLPESSCGLGPSQLQCWCPFWLCPQHGPAAQAWPQLLQRRQRTPSHAVAAAAVEGSMALTISHSWSCSSGGAMLQGAEDSGAAPELAPTSSSKDGHRTGQHAG